jgi:hypothetical protein
VCVCSFVVTDTKFKISRILFKFKFITQILRVLLGNVK